MKKAGNRIFAVTHGAGRTVYIAASQILEVATLARLIGLGGPLAIRTSTPAERYALAAGKEHNAIAEKARRFTLAELQVRGRI